MHELRAVVVRRRGALVAFVEHDFAVAELSSNISPRT
jgi:hypothetical protein